MARRKSKILTEVELEFMQIIWEREDTSTEDIQNTLAERDRRLSDGAIRRILAILMEKGYLTRRKQGLSFLYRAKVERNNAYGSMFRDLLTRVFGGSSSLMIASFLDTSDISPEELKKIKRLIEQRE
ncbi:MAG: BlaI/MecI/CopY family transcriptional regulator, partial [Candidatus Latescibacterota bacterium]